METPKIAQTFVAVSDRLLGTSVGLRGFNVALAIGWALERVEGVSFFNFFNMVGTTQAMLIMLGTRLVDRKDEIGEIIRTRHPGIHPPENYVRAAGWLVLGSMPASWMAKDLFATLPNDFTPRTLQHADSVLTLGAAFAAAAAVVIYPRASSRMQKLGVIAVTASAALYAGRAGTNIYNAWQNRAADSARADFARAMRDTVDPRTLNNRATTISYNGKEYELRFTPTENARCTQITASTPTLPAKAVVTTHVCRFGDA